MSADRPQASTWRDRMGRAYEALPGQGRTRVLWLVGIVVLAIVILGVIPGYIASQPQFYQRYANTSGRYKTWSTSVHANVSCQSCHIPPNVVSQAAYSVRMPGEFYLSLLVPSRPPMVLPVPTNAACQRCHTDLRKVSPSGDLNIPHRAHVDVLKLQCVQCHSYLVHTTNPAGNHKPTMSGCLRCHNGRIAKNNCAACHTNKALPANHQAADWVVIHPKMVKQVDCVKCHGWTTNWCAQCHSTRPRSHNVTWRTDHGQAVRTHRNCEACHVPAFCIRCHGTFPTLNLDPTLKLVR